MPTSRVGFTSTRSRPTTSQCSAIAARVSRSFRVAHPVGLRRHAAGDQRQVEHVDVDADVRPRIARDQLGDAFRANVVELAHRHHPVAVVDRVLDVRLDAPKAADTDLGEAQHVVHRGDVAKRVAVSEAQIVE